MKQIPYLNGWAENSEDCHIDMEMTGNFNVISKAKKERVIAGYANVSIIDSDEHYIPKETLKKGLETLLEDEGNYANVMVVHDNRQIGRVIESFTDNDNVEHRTHVDDAGLYIVVKFREKLETAQDIWSRIEKGDLNGFSIACEVIAAHEECNDDRCIKVLDHINIFEVSVTSAPVNELSTFSVISKSQIQPSCGCNNVENVSKNKSDDNERPMSEEDKVVEKDDPTIDGLVEFSDFATEYVKSHDDATIQDAMDAWLKKDEEKSEPEEKPAEEDEAEKAEEEEDDEEDEMPYEEDEEDEEDKSKDAEPEDNEPSDAELSNEDIAERLDALENTFKDSFDTLKSQMKQKDEELSDLQKANEEKDDLIASLEERVTEKSKEIKKLDEKYEVMQKSDDNGKAKSHVPKEEEVVFNEKPFKQFSVNRREGTVSVKRMYNI